jgi:hypothetical protein
VFSLLLPLLLTAGWAVASTLTCDSGNLTTFNQGDDVSLKGSIVSQPDKTSGNLDPPPPGAISGRVTPKLGSDGSNGTWVYDLGVSLPPGDYTLTVCALSSDSTPCVCSFTVNAKAIDPTKKKDTEELARPAAQGRVMANAAPTTCIHVTRVRVATAGHKQFVQVFGKVDSDDPKMKLHATMIGKILTDAGPQLVPFDAGRVLRSKAADGTTEVMAEFDVAMLPPGTYAVRLVSTLPTAIATRWAAVKVGNKATLEP